MRALLEAKPLALQVRKAYSKQYRFRILHPTQEINYRRECPPPSRTQRNIENLTDSRLARESRRVLQAESRKRPGAPSVLGTAYTFQALRTQIPCGRRERMHRSYGICNIAFCAKAIRRVLTALSDGLGVLDCVLGCVGRVEPKNSAPKARWLQNNRPPAPSAALGSLGSP